MTPQGTRGFTTGEDLLVKVVERMPRFAHVAAELFLSDKTERWRLARGQGIRPLGQGRKRDGGAM